MLTASRAVGPAAALLVAVLTTTSRGGRPRYPPEISAKLAKTARAVSAWTPCSGISPWELSDLVEGDIMPPHAKMRIVQKNETYKWENNVMPFTIEVGDFTEEEQKTIRNAVIDLNKLSCLTAEETHGGEDNFVRVTGKQQGCFAAAGRQGGEQSINLQPPACLSKGSIYHEFFHAFGLLHMHNSPNRDAYIRIIWGHVHNGTKNTFFKIHTKDESEDYGLRYDYTSLMHASRRAQSNCSLDTIETHDPTAVIGLKIKPSKFDIAQLNKLYGCPKG